MNYLPRVPPYTHIRIYAHTHLRIYAQTHIRTYSYAHKYESASVVFAIGVFSCPHMLRRISQPPVRVISIVAKPGSNFVETLLVGSASHTTCKRTETLLRTKQRGVTYSVYASKRCQSPDQPRKKDAVNCRSETCNGAGGVQRACRGKAQTDQGAAAATACLLPAPLHRCLKGCGNRVVHCFLSTSLPYPCPRFSAGLTIGPVSEHRSCNLCR